MNQTPILPLLACLVVPLPLAAQSPTPLGPTGGIALAVVVHPMAPNLILANRVVGGPLAMPYLSSDGGATFVPYANGLPSGSVGNSIRAFTQDPRDGHVLYAISGPTEIYKSADFGASWNLLADISSAANKLKGLAVPTSGTGMLAFDAWNVYRSSDDGATWVLGHSTQPYTDVFHTVTYAPSNPSVAFLGTLRQGVLRSTDGGRTFDDPDPGFTESIRAITVFPSSDQVVFAGGRNHAVAGAPGLYKSVDGGVTWSQPGTATFAPEIDPRFFGWEPDGSKVWLGTLGHGLFYSSDLGSAWLEANDGFTQPTPQHIPLGIAFDGQGYHYLSTESNSLTGFVGGGIYRNFDVGPWEHRAFGETAIGEVAIAGPGGDRIVATGSGALAAAKGAPLAATMALSWATAIAVDPTDPGRWLVGGSNAVNGAVITELTAGGQGSADAYVSWQPGGLNDIVFSPIDPASVLAGRQSFAGLGLPAILHSTDRGASWNEVSGTEDWSVKAIAFDPHTPGRVLALTTDNRWAESLVGGPNWGALQPAWPATPASDAILLEFDPHTPGVVYRGETGTGLWRSDDDGATWQPLGVGMHASSDLALHPEFPGLLFVSDDVGDVLVSADRGDTFSVLFDAPTQASGLAIDTADGSLLVGTTGASTWEFPAVSPLVNVGPGTPGTGGFTPHHYTAGGLPQVGNRGFTLVTDDLVGGAPVYLVFGSVETAFPLFGGQLYIGDPMIFPAGVASGTPGTGGAGSVSVALPLPNNPAFAGASFLTQFIAVDTGARLDPFGRLWSNGTRWTIR